MLTIHLPQGFQIKNAEVDGEKVEFANQAETAAIRIVPAATKAVKWRVSFAK